MKNFILITALLLFSVISFSQTPADLVGKWTITGMEQIENLDEETQEMFKKAISFNIDLKKDKKFTMTSKEKIVTGTWKLNGKIIELFSDKTKKTITFGISKYTKNELRIMVKEQVLILGRLRS